MNYVLGVVENFPHYMVENVNLSMAMLGYKIRIYTHISASTSICWEDLY